MNGVSFLFFRFYSGECIRNRPVQILLVIQCVNRS
jgi:hypothetical protein